MSKTSYPTPRLGLSTEMIRRAIYVLGAAPAVWFFYAGFTDQLGADPAKALEHKLGIYALRLLVLGLAITPLRRLGGPNLIKYRRAVGLLAFLYATLHLVAYVVFDQALDFGAIWGDVVKRPYITIGFVSFLVLVPLAATSNNGMIKRLGAVAWQRLHKWVYAACILAALHFLLIGKIWRTEPAVYALMVVILLGARVVFSARKRMQRPPYRPSPV